MIGLAALWPEDNSTEIRAVSLLVEIDPSNMLGCHEKPGLETAQSSSYLYTVGPKAGVVYALRDACRGRCRTAHRAPAIASQLACHEGAGFRAGL